MLFNLFLKGLYRMLSVLKLIVVELIVLFFRLVIAWSRFFCVDLQEVTFVIIRIFLEIFCCGFDEEILFVFFYLYRYLRNGLLK